jgi:hypothetical protein
MEVILLAIQARILLWVGFAYLAVGVWLGTDPATLAWRAPLAAVVAMTLCGWMLRQVAAVIHERLATDEAERRLAAEQAATAQPAPAVAAAQQRLATKR